jgi:hypothetical protein
MREAFMATSYLDALTAEIRILIRTIATDPTKRLSAVKVRWLDAARAPKDLTYPEVVAHIAHVDPPLAPSATAVEIANARTEELIKIGLLQAIRDELVQLTAPATGLSIAYTSLVTGNERGSDADSMNGLAKQAYGGLSLAAKFHKWMMFGLSMVSLLLAVFAAWEATKASVGKNLLQVLDPLRVQQTAVASDKFKLEVAIDKDIKPAGFDASYLPVCLRHILTENSLSAKPEAKLISSEKLVLHTSPQIREVCGRDEILSGNFKIAHDGLFKYLHFWPDVAGGLYSVVGHAAAPYIAPAEFVSSAVLRGSVDATAPEGPGVTGPTDDIELFVAPVVQVLSSFILPFTFGVLGSFMYVLLHYYSNLKANTLIPRDRALAVLRLVLGVVVAACVSLLITSYAGPNANIQPSASGSSAPGTLVGSLTLSASALTLLAGFGAEAVFTLLQGLVERVFALSK